MNRHILIVDDELDIRKTLAGVLEDEGFNVKSAENGSAALKMIDADPPDLVLLDIWMPGMDGLEVLSRIKEKHSDIAVIMISGHGSIDTAVKATKLGATDFFEKPLSLDEILLTTQNVMNMVTLRSENKRLREQIQAEYEILGSSTAIQMVRDQIERAAPSDGRVLITGENGTGKELVARHIHLLSNRRDKTLIVVNCAAIPEELIESELFGHEKGSFTGAVGKRRGKFDLADGGTIFLDEIADMSLRTQAKILRILQERSFERVGGSEVITVDARVIAATNKNLEALIKEDRFREDLYFRLNVIPIHVPPLRERRDDIACFVEHFMKQYCVNSGLTTRIFTPDALEVLRSYSWPGNVRELKNIVERLVIMTPNKTVSRRDVSQTLKAGDIGDRDGAGELLESESWREAKAEFERAYLVKKLHEHGGNISRTAEAIGVERTHLHRRIKALEIEPDS